ncbi:MAG: WD40 repeat domain-containing protein [Planctomycetia bacterium]|nr:WD40 repeat domain-containing protein [Planctomycetia bacterium]
MRSFIVPANFFPSVCFVLTVMGVAMTQPIGIAADAAPAPAATPVPAANLTDFTRWVIAADYSGDTMLLVTAGGESLLYRPGDVVVWKADGSTRIGDLSGHPTAVWAVKVSKDSKLAATAGYDGLVKLWDLASRTLKNDLKRQGDPKKNGGWVRSLDFSPDGSKLATASEDGSVVIWDTANGAELKLIAAHASPVTSIAFSPDGTTLATGGGDKVVKLWDVAAGTEKGKLEGHTDSLWTVVYSPDGSKLATAGADRTIKLWNTSDSKEFATLSSHKDWVTSASFSPDGTRLATGSLDGSVKLWDVISKAEQVGPEAAKSSVWCVNFSPDGKTIFVGSHVGGRLLPTPEPKLAPPPPPPPTPPPAPPAAASADAQKWSPLVPTAFTSVAGASGSIAADGIVMITGNLAKDTYTLKAVLPAGIEPKAFKIEVLADPSLPSQGPGRAPNGNFVLSKLAIMFGPPGSTETPTDVKFAGFKADYEQQNFGISGAVDDNPGTGWAIEGGVGKDHAATFEIAADGKISAGAPLSFTLEQLFNDVHTIGKLKLSVRHEVPPATAAEAKPEEPKK